MKSEAAYAEWSRMGRKGSVWISGLALDPHRAADPAHIKDYQRRLICADAMAHHWDVRVEVCPELNNQFDPRYPEYFGGVPCPGKLPDFRIGAVYWEMKSYSDRFKAAKIASMLDSAVGQCPNLIIKMNHHYNLQILLEKVRRGVISSPVRAPFFQQIIIVDEAGDVHEVPL